MKTFLRTLPAIAWAVLLFTLSAQSSLPVPPLTFDGIDKLEHAGAYGILAGLIIFAQGLTSRRAVLVAVVLTSLYGASDELHQVHVPGRSADVLDWAADTIGGCVMSAGAFIARRRR